MRPSIFESPDSAAKLGTAKNLHALGRIADAEKLYREVLAQNSSDAEAMGLLAIAMLQRGNSKEAKKLLRQSLSASPPAWVYLRNLHPLLALLEKEGKDGEAARLADGGVPDWPALRLPDPSERAMLLGLARTLARLKRPDAAARLLESAIATLPADAELLYELARAHKLKGDLQATWTALAAADAAIQPNTKFGLLTELYACANALGKKTEAVALRNRIAAETPAFVFPRQAGHKAGILILSGFPNFKYETKTEFDLHFSGNYPTQLVRVLADEFHFSSVFSATPAGREAAANIPAPDLIINNFANAELLLAEGDAMAEAAFADSFGVPVINHPKKVLPTTRDRTAELVADIPGLVAPRTSRFSRTGKSVEDLADEIESQYGYPLITRTLSSQQGKGMVKVDDRDALIRFLSEDKKEDFFVTAFVDSRGEAKLYRKIRAAIVGGEIIVTRVDYSPHWNVHGRKSDEHRIAFYRNNRDLLAREDQICTDPHRELGQPAMQALQAIGDRIPLDIFGVDFDVAPDGQLVFYEANATMNLLSTAPPDIDHPRHMNEHLVSTLRNYLNSLL